MMDRKTLLQCLKLVTSEADETKIKAQTETISELKYDRDYWRTTTYTLREKQARDRGQLEWTDHIRDMWIARCDYQRRAFKWYAITGAALGFGVSSLLHLSLTLWGV